MHQREEHLHGTVTARIAETANRDVEMRQEQKQYEHRKARIHDRVIGIRIILKLLISSISLATS